MGRTQRKRSQKRTRNFYTCDNSQELILLNSWLVKQGKQPNKKLVLAVFDDTGRGLLTRKKIQAGEELMNLPLNLTINVTSILMDVPFCSIFLDNSIQCLLAYRCSMSFQSLMAFYITFLKIQGTSKWSVYLDSLPKEYTVPYFLPNDLKCYMDFDILSVVSKQNDEIKSSFHIFKEILKSNLSSNANIKSFKDGFKLSTYEWAYFTVNTRCVYMDLTNLIDLKNIQNSILNIVKDNTKISLCPYLDMINHSPNARNETKLVVNKSVENICISRLHEDLFSDVRFSIYTKNDFDAYTQVFICYGDSHNLKLITEYGFFIPNNDLDYVSFNFEGVQNFLNTNCMKLSQEQISFINSHGLNKALYIDSRGLSFNFYALLMVVKYYYNHDMNVSRLIYSAAVCSNDIAIRGLVTPMVRDKLVNIKESICNLESYGDKCVILNNCVALMCQYVSILEKFIKS